MIIHCECDNCGMRFDIQDNESVHCTQNTNNTNYLVLCETCFHELRECVNCHEYIMESRAYTAHNENNEHVIICRNCRGLCIRCAECGDYMLPNSPMFNGRHGTSYYKVCEHCKNHLYNECGFCGTLFRRQTFTINGNSHDDICPVCVNVHYKECSQCGNYFTSDNMGNVDGNRMCNDCISAYARVCDDCGNMTTDYYPTEGGELICRSCARYSGNWFYCDSCSVYTSSEHNHYGIRNYSYKPNPIFHGKDINGLQYGIEDEVENRSNGNYDNNETAKYLLENFSENESLFYIKSDGSLHDGMEIVTHPFTITKLMKADFLPKILAELDSRGFKSHDTSTCGLHVHMSKSAFVDGLHQTRFAWYLYESGFTTKIARRSYNSYCLKVQKHLSDSNPENYSSTRYEAVNFENTHTIEVRIFKGTLKAQTIYITLLFLDAVFHWTESVRLPVLSSTNRDSEFLKFLKHKPKYTKLYDYLTHSTN